MQQYAKAPSCYRMGGRRAGGISMNHAKIVFATAGLAFRWYASEGPAFLRWYGGVFFDEVGDMERDPEYALLWDVARHVSQGRSLKLVVASATMGVRMRDHFTSIGAHSIVCHMRPFPAQCHVSND